MIKRLGTIAAAAAIASLTFATIPASATTQSPSPTLTVKATVITNCTTMNSQTMDFGQYDPLGAGPYNSSATFSSKCSSGDSVNFTVDNGSNYGLAGGTYTTARAMKNGSNYLAYYLCSASCTGSNNWPAGGNTQTGNGVTGTALSWTVYGQIPVSQDVPSTGSNVYQDTVTVTLSY